MDTLTTTKDRFDAALKTARRNGVKIRLNVMSCCRGCSEPFAQTPGFDEDTTAYAWTFGGQGNAVSWLDGEPYYRSEVEKAKRDGRFRWSTPMWSQHQKAKAITDRIYFSHGNGGGQVLADAFTAQGFEVEDYDPANPDRYTVTVVVSRRD